VTLIKLQQRFILVKKHMFCFVTVDWLDRGLNFRFFTYQHIYGVSLKIRLLEKEEKEQKKKKILQKKKKN